MNSISFKKNLLSVQEELLRFAYKLTADREEANDLLQVNRRKREQPDRPAHDRSAHHAGGRSRRCRNGRQHAR